VSRIILISFFIALISNFAAAQTDTNNPHTVLWKVYHPQNQDTSYLFGVNHNFTGAYLDRFPIIKEKLLSSYAVLNEFDLLHIKQEGSSLKFEDSLLWFHYVTKKQRRRIMNFFVDHHYMESFINTLDIYNLHSIFNTIVGFYYAKTLESKKGEEQLEYYCARLAKDNNIITAGLENMEEHFGNMHQIYSYTPVPVVAEMKQSATLLDSLINIYQKKPESYVPDFADWMKDYYHLNFSYDFKTTPSLDDLTNKNIMERNQRWLPELTLLFENHPAFIIVGVSHLCYTWGIISLLREKGYIVEPVKMD